MTEYLRAVGAHLRAASRRADPARNPRHGDMVSVEALEFGVQIVPEMTPFCWRQLQRVRQCIVPLAKQFCSAMPFEPPPFEPLPCATGARPRKRSSRSSRRARQQTSSASRMQPAYARVFVLLLDEAKAALAGLWIVDAAHRCSPTRRARDLAYSAGYGKRRLFQRVVRDSASVHAAREFRRHAGHVQFGNGWRLDFLASRISSGTRERRRRQLLGEA